MRDQGSTKWTPDQTHSAGPNNEATQQFGAVPQEQYQQQPYGQQYPQPPYGQQYPASYQQPEKRGGPNTWLLVLVALLLAALVGVLAFLGGSGAFTRTSEPVTSTVVETHTLPSSSAQSPEPAAPAPEPAVKTRTYSHYAPDTSVTTASFAPNVFAAFQDAYASTGTTEVTVSAYSPETKLTYRMSCSGDEVVYCSGGNNARVRIW
mgnify:FL=1